MSGERFVLLWKRAVGLSPDAHPNDDKTVVRMGHPDCAAIRFGLRCPLLLGGEDFLFEALLFEEVAVVAAAGEEFVVGA